FRNPADLSEHVARIASTTLAFELHHEFAHYRLGHSLDAASHDVILEMEKDADTDAINLILGDAQDDIWTSLWCLAACVSTAFSCAVRMYSHRRGYLFPGPPGMQTHPYPY